VTKLLQIAFAIRPAQFGQSVYFDWRNITDNSRETETAHKKTDENNNWNFPAPTSPSEASGREFAVKPIDLASVICSTINYKLRRKQITKIHRPSLRPILFDMKPVGKTARTSFPLRRQPLVLVLDFIDFPLCEKPLVISCRANSKQLPSTTAIIDLIWSFRWSGYWQAVDIDRFDWRAIGQSLCPIASRSWTNDVW